MDRPPENERLGLIERQAAPDDEDDAIDERMHPAGEGPRGQTGRRVRREAKLASPLLAGASALASRLPCDSTE